MTDEWQLLKGRGAPSTRLGVIQGHAEGLGSSQPFIYAALPATTLADEVHLVIGAALEQGSPILALLLAN